MRRNAIVVLLGVLLMGVFALDPGGLVEARQDQGTAQSAIVGSWQVTINAGPNRPALGLTTFTSDGTLFTSNPASRPAPGSTDGEVWMISTAHGAWVATGDDAVAFRFLYFQSDATGQLLGPTTIDATVTIAPDGMSWAGTFTATVTDLAGTATQAGSGTVSATRITVPAPGTPEATPTA